MPSRCRSGFHSPLAPDRAALVPPVPLRYDARVILRARIARGGRVAGKGVVAPRFMLLSGLASPLMFGSVSLALAAALPLAPRRRVALRASPLGEPAASEAGEALDPARM